MAQGEGAEQFRTAFLPPVKHIGQENGISVSKKKKKNQGVSVCSKVCFAIGGAPYQITGSALGFFLQIYLLDVAQLDAFHASIILFVGRAWDAVTDPTVGFLVSRTTWTRHGRLMPWIVISTPFAVLSYFLIWVVPPLENGKVVWYLFFYCIFQSLQTCFHVPYSALTMFISSEQKERDSATAYRMTVEVFGTVLGTAIQGQIVGGANAPCLNPKDLNDSYAAQLITEVNISRVSLDDTKKAYMWASGLICIIYVLCAVILFLGVREQRDVRCVKSVKSLSFMEGLKLLQSHGPYFKLVMAFLFTSLAFMLMEGNFALFLTYTMGLRNDFQNILLTIMISATLTIPLWQHLLSRYGKKTITYIGTLWAVPFMILVVCIESNLVITYIVSVAAGASVGVAFFLPWSMLPDAVDDYKVQHPNTHGHEAIFYSFYVFFTKFASGISLGLSTLSLHFAGYVTRACVQPDSVNLTLKLLVSAAPATLIILGLLILKSYPINEERRRENHNRLLTMMQDCREQHLEISV